MRNKWSSYIIRSQATTIGGITPDENIQTVCVVKIKQTKLILGIGTLKTRWSLIWLNCGFEGLGYIPQIRKSREDRERNHIKRFMHYWNIAGYIREISLLYGSFYRVFSISNVQTQSLNMFGSVRGEVESAWSSPDD